MTPEQTVMIEQDELMADTPRDTRVEAILDRWNIAYQLEADYPLKRLKIEDATQVRAADHRAPAASVQEYAQHMSHGAIFPPVVVATNGMLIDGNTRVGAAERNSIDALPAYVVKLGNLGMAAMIGAAINQTNGRRLAPDELVGAAEKYLELGYTDDAVARELGCSSTHVRNVRKERLFRDAAERTGVTATVPKTYQRILAGVDHDEPFRAATELVAEANPTQKDANALVEELTKARSDADAVAIVNAKRDEWAPAGPPPRRAPTGVKPGKALKAAAQLVELINGDPHGVVSVGDDRAKHAAVWRDLEPLVVRVCALYSVEAASDQT